MGVMMMARVEAAPALRAADNLHYLSWCRTNAFMFADGAPSARRSAIRMNEEYVRAAGREVPDQWVVR